MRGNEIYSQEKVYTIERQKHRISEYRIRYSLTIVLPSVIMVGDLV